MDKLSGTPGSVIAEKEWQPLYRLGGISAIVTVVLIPLSIIAYFIWPIYPDNIFEVIQQSKLAGVMSLDLMYLLGNIVSIPLMLAVYISLRRAHPSYALIALVLWAVGLTLIFAARPIFEMVSLSDQYAAATTAAEKSQIMAAAIALQQLFNGTAYFMHYLLGTLSLLLFSYIMLDSQLYTKTVALVGIVSNLLAFALVIPTIGVYLSILSVFGLAIWYVLIARVLLRLARA